MKPMRVNIGCGGRPLPEYINIDSDSLEEMKKRYPEQTFPDGVEIFDYDIFNLPFKDGTVDEVRADSLIEHLSFLEEPKFFYEVKRVLASGGIFRFSTPDFEKAAQLFLEAKDDWKDFYRNDPEAIASEHWFGQGSYRMDTRWGYLMATFFGSQNGEGQFHKNAYTDGKIRAILKKLGFIEDSISHSRWKGTRDYMIDVVAKKI